MAVREFAQGEHVAWAVGTSGLDQLLFGAFTVAAICKRGVDADQGALLNLAAGAGGSRGFFRYTDDDAMDYLRGQFQSPGAGPLWTPADDWVLVAFTRPAGDSMVRYHKYVYATDTWTHADSAGTVGNDDNTCDRAETRYQETGGWVFQGRYAVMAVWGSVLSDVALEGLTTSYGDWQEAAPMTLWRFDQAATTDSIDDQTGGGADQTALVGSTVVAGDDPPGFSFSTGPSEGAAALGLGLQLQAAGARESAGTGAAGIGLQLTAAGARDSASVAGFGFGLRLAATGARLSLGQAHLTVGLRLAASTVVVAPAPPERRYVVAAESRRVTVAAEPRVMVVPAESRTVRVEA